VALDTARRRSSFDSLASGIAIAKDLQPAVGRVDGRPYRDAIEPWEVYAMGLDLDLVAKFYWRRAKRRLAAWTGGVLAVVTRLI
jgi:hypothetical protein